MAAKDQWTLGAKVFGESGVRATKAAAKKAASDVAEQAAKKIRLGVTPSFHPAVGAINSVAEGFKGLLSPAGLSEEVAGRIAGDVSKKDFIDAAKKEAAPIPGSPMKRPRTKA